MKPLLLWTPRVLAIALAAWLGVFALDVFGEVNGLWNTAIALFMHLVPALCVVAALVVAWRAQAAGGILFVLLGSWYMLLTLRHPGWWLVISGPLFLIGGLFLADWTYRARLGREV
jgi:hypothetical protein